MSDDNEQFKQDLLQQVQDAVGMAIVAELEPFQKQMGVHARRMAYRQYANTALSVLLQRLPKFETVRGASADDHEREEEGDVSLAQEAHRAIREVAVQAHAIAVAMVEEEVDAFPALDRSIRRRKGLEP